MTQWQLILNNLKYYWRSHLAVLAGAMVSCAIIVGALSVGDSVRFSLKQSALERLGGIHTIMNSENRFIRSTLAQEISKDVGSNVASVLRIGGVGINPNQSLRANNIQVLGVDKSFWQFSNKKASYVLADENHVVINQSLANYLAINKGDELLLRIEKPDDLPRDAPLSEDQEIILAIRLVVQDVIKPDDLANFNLQANQVVPMNAFVNLSWLGKQIEQVDRSNLLLIGQSQKNIPNDYDAVFRKHFSLDDAKIEIREDKKNSRLELRSKRIFIEPGLSEPAKKVSSATPIFSYFVNNLNHKDKKTPYSIVASVDSNDNTLYHDKNIKNNEIHISQWLAEDLGATIGDPIVIKYFVMDMMRKLIEKERQFTVSAIYDDQDVFSDRTLMPDFPGISDSENCRDWDPGIPINLEDIRDKDEVYWDDYRGTPKAVISFESAQEIWGNRFGGMTAIRYDVSQISKEQLEKEILAKIQPKDLGFHFQPVRDQAFNATTQGMDFGQLFIGFSFFIIVSSVILLALLFALGIEQRQSQTGLFLSIGLGDKTIKYIYLVEGFMLGIIGSIAGSFIGVFYTKGLIYGLTTVWSDAIAKAPIQFYMEPRSMIIGIVSSILIILFSIWLVVRKQLKQTAGSLIGNNDAMKLLTNKSNYVSKIIGVICILLALVLLGMNGFQVDHKNAGVFFGVGGIMLLACLCFGQAYLKAQLTKASKTLITFSGFSIRNTTRRQGRSMAVIILLACGSFIVLAVAANRHDLVEGAFQRNSGTGGFAFYAQSALPLFHDLNDPDRQEDSGMNTEMYQNVSYVQGRTKQGDDASCLNLNRAQVPKLMGVNPDQLAQRHSFKFLKTTEKSDPALGWNLLSQDYGDNVVPAIGDMNTIRWSLGKSVDARLQYTDEKGRTFDILIVGMIGNSILQGQLVISEDDFIRKFPSASGYQQFLIDAPFDKLSELEKQLAWDLQDIGMDVQKSVTRLTAFNAVENTYLSIFQILGGFGLLLGSAGLAVVVMRNVLERRSEFGIMRAFGYTISDLYKLVLYEHWFLLVMGILFGVISAVVAVLPSLVSNNTDVPYISILITFVIIFLSGLFWVALASRWAIKGPLLDSIRNE